MKRRLYRFAVLFLIAGPYALADAAGDFTALGDKYLAQYFKAEPSAATSAGVHDYDEQIEDLSRSFNASRIADLKQLLGEFEAVKTDALTAEAKIDRELALGAIRAELLERETVRHWETNPDLYSSTASNAVYVIMSRAFAPPDVRLRAVIAREKKIPALLKTAHQNLKNPPRIFTTVALEQLPGIIDFFRRDVPSAFSEVKDPRLLSDFTAANGAVIEALGAYQKYLKGTVLGRSHGDFRLGAENFRRKLLYEEMTDIQLPELLRIGEKNLRENQKALAAAVKRVDPKRPEAAVLAELEKDHPTADGLLPSMRNLLGSLRAYITDHQIATIPSAIDPIVQETPPFMRALTFASMDTPGPFETHATEAYYNVTLPEKDWSPQRIEEHLTGYNRGVLVSTSIHEAFPGHYVQFLWVPSAPSRLRKILGANSNAEGWAHYCEQMMLDEGYGGGDPKLRVGQLEDALLRNARFMVGIQMHTGNMTYDQAIAYFMKEGHLSHANAERETKRGTLDPTYLYYTLGKLEILKLRDDYRQAMGARYSLRQFHDSFLKEGFPPIKLVRRALLGNDSPVL